MVKVLIPIEKIVAAIQNHAKIFPTKNNGWQMIKYTSYGYALSSGLYPPKHFMKITDLTKGQWNRFKRTGTLHGSKEKAKIISIWANPNCYALYKAYLLQKEPSVETS